VAGSKVDADMTPLTPSEDFSAYAEKIPGMFFFLGIVPPGTDPLTAAPNHSPYFFADEAALPVGVRALSSLAVDYLASGGMKKGGVKVSGR
jgi:amidohydrolase